MGKEVSYGVSNGIQAVRAEIYADARTEGKDTSSDGKLYEA